MGADDPRLPPLPPLPKGARLWVAFSGGCDSTALLHLLRRAGARRLHVAHVHHGLQAVADDWVQHCRLVCRELQLPLKTLRVRIDPDHPAGPEGAAREARYAALRELLRPGDCLVTAHHRDDQAETVLLRLLRGSGIAGVAAMRPLLPFEPGWLWRPLLQLTRRELEDYATRMELDWIEDPHNFDPAYARSWLRREIMPRLRQRWPQAVDSLARFAGHAAETVELLEDLAAQDLKTAALAGGLSIQAVLALAPARRRNLLRYWLATQGQEAPPAEQLGRLEREVLSARPDALPRLRLGQRELRRYRDLLCLLPRLPAPPAGIELAWPRRRKLELPPGCGQLSLARAPPAGLSVRFPAGGERLRPVGQTRTRSLKNLFQEAGIPPWVRERTPLLWREGELVAVAGFWRSADGPQAQWLHDLAGVPPAVLEQKH